MTERTKPSDGEPRRDPSTSAPTAPARPLPPGPAPEETEDRVGPYRILECLGKGGMGIVYLAEQTQPVRRRVALKLLKLGMDTQELVARFESEKQALALMSHPNIATVYDAGATDRGRPYFAMEYVPGVPITTYCDDHRLTTRQRLELFVPVCNAIQHAHQKGIIHRDVKPTNVLVMVGDGKPIPKIIDFGVAKAISGGLAEKRYITRHSQLVGTPVYMSPEQAENSPLDVDSRTDVYSLGVLLYEVLVGALPFDAGARKPPSHTPRRMTDEDEPKRPSERVTTLGDASSTVAKLRRTDPRALVHQLRGDLDWIVMKAIEPDRTRRYATASELAADVERHLNDEPVSAGPPSAAYRLRKFAAKHRGLVAAVACVALALLGGILVSTSLYLDAKRERTAADLARADALEASRKESDARRASDAAAAKSEKSAAEAAEARDEAQKRADTNAWIDEFLKNMLLAVDPGQDGRDVRVSQLLDGAAKTLLASPMKEPEVQASLESTIGKVYYSLGLHSEAETLFHAALEIRQRVLVGDRRALFETMNDDAACLAALGRVEESEKLLREALAAQKKLLGETDEATLETTANLAEVMRLRFRATEAEELARHVLDVRRRTLGEDNAKTLNSMNNYAVILQDLGRARDAERLYRDVIRIGKEALKPEHPVVRSAVHNLAFLLQTEEARWPEAESLLKEAVDEGRRSLGEAAPDTLASARFLAVLLREEKKWPEARALYEEIVRVCERARGADDAEALVASSGLAQVIQDSGDVTAAEPVFRKAVEGLERCCTASDGRLLEAQMGLGVCLVRLKRFDEAEATLRWAYDHAKYATKVPVSILQGIVEALVELYDASGKTELADEWERKLPPSSPLRRKRG
jgi:eukaryotic-like serine/threonine-protein kinase